MTDLTYFSFSLPPPLRTEAGVAAVLCDVAAQQSEPSFHLLQESVYWLSSKVEQGRAMTSTELAFVEALFRAPWWGGLEYGAYHSGALQNNLRPTVDPNQVSLMQMQRHYMDGAGRFYPLCLAVYQGSSVVADTLAALKNHIRELLTLRRSATFVATTDTVFLQSRHAEQVERKRLHARDKGFIFTDGTLVLEQREPWLLNLGNRFRITGMTSVLQHQLMTRWRIEGSYRFPPFDAKAPAVELPLCSRWRLRIPVGLGHYLAEAQRASPFDYFVDWAERYPLMKLK